MSYDLQAAGTYPNGSCFAISEGELALSYRIGVSSRWKVIQRHIANSKYNFSVAKY